MRVYKASDYQDMSRKAANIISAQIILKPDSVLGLATGSTPIGIYRQLIDWYNKGDLDFNEVKTVNLDEYKGLAPVNKQSYHFFMNHNLFQYVNINKENTFLPDGMAQDSELECNRFDHVIEQLGGIDLQLLGLGHNGHIGFNEPGEAFEKGTHCVALTESTIEANSRLFAPGEVVPSQAYTMGIQTIMLAKKILLVVSGKDKAEILNKALTGPIVPYVPASILQMHPDLTVVADSEAASLLDESLFANNIYAVD
jgi:glucosamine-6-phosphate deaminase